MAKLEIRDLDHLVEVNEQEMGEIKGGALPDPMPRWLNQFSGNSLSSIVLRRRYSFATPIEIP